MVIGVVKNLYWMLSDDINCYMEVLCLKIIEDVYFVDVDWFSYKVMKDGYFSFIIFFLENSSCNWFIKLKIVVFVNV